MDNTNALNSLSMKHLKIATVSLSLVALSACATTTTDSMTMNSSTPTMTSSAVASATSMDDPSQIKEINGLKIAFPAQWSISPARGGGPNVANSQAWEIASSATAAANDEGGIGMIICPMNTLDGYDNPNDIHEKRSITKGSTVYDIALNILNQRSEIEPWLTSILFSKKGSNLQDKNNSCSMNFYSDNPFTQVEKDVYRKIYQSIQ